MTWMGTLRRTAHVAALTVVGLAFIGPSVPLDGVALADAPLTQSVDPMIGTAGNGSAFPGAVVPFGMVQLSPDTGGGGLPPGYHPGGYHGTDPRLDGFSHTHLSGTGCNSYGHVRMMPTTGAIETTPEEYGSQYRHPTEAARAGSYDVDLLDTGIHAELTASARVGFHRYTFPQGASGNVLFDIGRTLKPVTGADLSIVGNDTVEGQVSNEAFCFGGGPVTVYFTAKFDRPFSEFGTWQNNTVGTGQRTVSGTNSGGWVRFATDTNQVVQAKVGISFVSLAGARANLAAEGATTTFDAAKAAAAADWEQFLGRVRVEGGTADQRTKFYTALYHAGIQPNVFSDVNGDYPGFDGAVHKAVGYTRYANFSLWDSFRTEQQLLALVAPERAHDMLVSMIEGSREAGWVPRWTLANVETNIQTGDSVTAALVDGYLKGLLTPAQAEEAYTALLRNATESPPPGSPAIGRTGIADYLARGFAPFSSSPYEARAAASATLEYALADCTLSTLADRLGHRSEADALYYRAGNYAKLFDSSSGFFRPRDASGDFVEPFDPAGYGFPPSQDPVQWRGYDEGSAWQYLWYVPQDIRGLVRLLGGRQNAANKLDAFFDYSELSADPSRAAALWVGGDRYAPENEPDMQAPYAYAWAGQPWKTQLVVRSALDHVFGTGSDGLPGNDDLGTLSSWFVLSSLGLYPASPGFDHYVLSSPLFPRAVIDLQSPYYTQDTFTIDAPGASSANRYIQSAQLGGAALSKPWLSHQDLRSAAGLALQLGTQPNTAFGSALGSAPPSPCGQAPFNVATANPRALSGVTFDAAPAREVDAAGGRYEWDFDGDGNVDIAGTSAERPTWIYARPGRYRVDLRIVDGAGSRRGTTTISVGDPDPTAAVPGPQKATGVAAPKLQLDRTMRSVAQATRRALERLGLARWARTRAISFPVELPVGGVLRINVIVPALASATGARRRGLVATGRRRFHRGGTARLRLRTSRAGRRLLRTRRTRTLSIRAVFDPRGGTRVASSLRIPAPRH